MKNKKYLLLSLVIFLCVLVLVFAISSIRSRNTVEKVMYHLESAINSGSIKNVINLYPEYYHDTLSNWLSQTKLDEFNNQFGDINIEIIFDNNYDPISASNNIKNEINNNFGTNIDVEDYHIIIAKVTSDTGTVFEQAQFQIIKIKGIYYLYADYYQGELIQCFIE